MAAKYEAILKDLSQRIATMKPGERLPGEQLLAQEYGVSGMTVRRALQVLLEAGRIMGVRGRGTFVTQPVVTKRMVMSSFTDSMKAAGMTARATVLSASLLPADEATARDLEMPVGEQVFMLVRLRYGDDMPLCVDDTILRAAYFPGLLGVDLTGSLYELMRKKYRIELARAQSRVSAVVPSAEEAQLLGISRRQPCIRVLSRSHTTDGRVAERTVSLYRGDRYELYIEPV